MMEMKYFCDKLQRTQVLVNHIREKLPDMKARLNTLMGQAQQELNSFGDAAIFGDKNQVGWSLNMVYLIAHRLLARSVNLASHESICPRLHCIH